MEIRESPADAAPALYATFPRRLLALSFDGAFLVLLLLVGTGFAGALPDSGGRSVNIAVLVAMLLYEPVLVSRFGSTLGHRVLNLRVAAEPGGGRLPFAHALLRALVKGFLGLLSFVFIAFTRRHQALHDLVARATVQVRDASRAQPLHFAPERVPVPPGGRVSWPRRVAMAVVYLAVVFLAYAVGLAILASAACLDTGVCTPGEELMLEVLLLAWLAASVWILVLAARGRLWSGGSPVPAPAAATLRAEEADTPA